MGGRDADIGAMKKMRDDHGIQAIEMGMALLMVMILVALAFPVLSKVRSEAEDVAAIAAERAAAVEAAIAGDADGDDVQVAGVQLERSTDGATCRWTTSSSGTVFGVWELGARSLFGTFAAVPESCPTAADAEAAGFAPSFVAP